MNDLFVCALRHVHESDMVGITIRNEVNLQDKAIGISFRWRDQLSPDRLIVVIQSVMMPVGFGKTVVKPKGRPLSVIAHVKRNNRSQT